MPPELERLVREIIGSIADHNTAIAVDRISVDDWALLVARDLLAGHYAGYMVGRGTKDIGRSKATVDEIVGTQLEYLNAFADTIRAEGWRDAFGARAAMYGAAIKESFWRGRTWGLDLPYYPAQGTQCLTNCGCSWQIDYHGDPEYLNADARWVRGKSDSCKTCVSREMAGALHFKEGVRV